ncbi:Uncharacterised protein [Mycobacteroides abscessus subsp. massiliense]|uniref:hypothetical protein n=1 Tax=Mycobacteroides abscessus TaxID=36809 RepID=UPI0009A57E3C|nr:hypothetical protein [Mycobacteroides abscessus]SKU60635.1 Uncharacterised protein [Mycobacteroides abscessus subsp. massiliense]
MELAAAKRRVCEGFRTEIEDPVALLAIGLTQSAWRNTVVEEAHAGPRSSFHDGEMFAANVANTRLIYKYLVDYPDVDWQGLADEFVDPHRVLAGRTIVELLGKTRHKLWEKEARKQIEAIPYAISHFGAELTLWVFANGGQPFSGACPEWWGSPWWPEFIEKFTAALTDNPPGINGEELKTAFLERPEDIDPEVLLWCVHDQGMQFFFYRNVGPWARDSQGR